MLPGIDVLKKIFFYFVFLIFSFGHAALAQEQSQASGEDIKKLFAVVKDLQGETLEGFLRSDANELTVLSQDNQEKKIPLKLINSITLEKQKTEFQGEEQKSGVKYAVRVENSQEIFTLSKKYTFSLDTKLGITTKSLDPDLVGKVISKESLHGTRIEDGKPLFEDKSVVFSLKIKF
jgi:Asp-tRNA(Asn)/Glu-tRNA(Gln) amidotransferase B subunit